MGGQKRVHQYVLEQITGVVKARQDGKRQLFATAVAVITFAIITFCTNPSSSQIIGLSITTLFLAIPYGVITQRLSLQLALSRERLALKRYLIGKKGYLGPKSAVLHNDIDVFAIACNLVCKEDFLSPNDTSVAWHTFGTLTDKDSVAVYTGWYQHNQPIAFLYGDPRMLAEMAEEIWDLGHVRTKSPSDTTRFEKTVAGWKRQHLLPVALAYAPLPKTADPASLSSKDLKKGSILLGAVGLAGNESGHREAYIAPASATSRSTSMQMVITLCLGLFTAGASILTQLLGRSLLPNGLQILTIALFIAPLLLTSYTWDHPRIKALKQSFGQSLWIATTIGGLGLGVQLLYLYLVKAPVTSVRAIGLLTIGLCLLVLLILARIQGNWRTIGTYINPFFLISSAASLVMLLIMTYVTGPLLPGGLLIALGASLMFIALHEIKAYADRHHTREHIIGLLDRS